MVGIGDGYGVYRAPAPTRSPKSKWDLSGKSDCECVCKCSSRSDYKNPKICIHCDVWHDHGRGNTDMKLGILFRKIIQRKRCYCGCGCSMKKNASNKACEYCLSFCHPNKYKLLSKILKVLSR